MWRAQDEQPLRPEQLQTIKEHQYSCRGSSIFEKYFQVFWCGLIPFIPTWIAPNTLTLVGLAINFISSVILLHYSPDLQSEVPPWSLFFSAFCVFTYQTLDALDGKQARRTNSVTPLGELFDHGCDAIATIFVPMSLFVAVGIGSNPVIAFCLFFTCLSMFYLAHWQCYITGYLEFGTIDVTEGQVGIMGVLLWSAIFGVGFWNTTIPLIGIPLKFLPFLTIMVSGALNTFRFFSIMSRGGAGKAGTTVANTSVLFPAFPFGVVLFLAAMCAVRSPIDLYTNHLVLFLLSFGFVAAKVIMKLVVDHMSKSEMTLLDSGLIGPFALFFNQYFNFPIPESFVLWCFFYSLGYYMHYMTTWPEYMRVMEAPILTAFSSKLKSTLGGRLMGYMIAKSEGRGESWHGHVTALSVAPEYRRIGLASRLMHGMEDTSDRKNCYFSDLFVRASNGLGHSVYTKMGYIIYRRVLNYYSGNDDGEDAFDMRKALLADKEKKSVVPLTRSVTADELEFI